MAFTTSADYIRFGLNYITDYGLDFDLICGRTGIDTTVFTETGARISFFEIIELWEMVERRSMDQNFGLHVGEKMADFSGHILFLLLSNAATLQDAVALLCKYWSLLTDIHSPRLRFNDKHAELSIYYHAKGPSMYRHKNEAVLVLYASILQRLIEEKISFDQICFSHPRPENISEHQRIFNSPLYFNRTVNKLVFRREYLELPVLLSNQNLCRNLESIAIGLLESRYKDGFWSDKVRKEIFNILGRQKSSIESVSEKLAITPRNLQYKLKNEGTTYQQLLEQIRKEKAVYLLKQASFTIGDTASLLGFSEQSAFSRAFKRWYGLSPKHYLIQARSKHLADPYLLNTQTGTIEMPKSF